MRQTTLALILALCFVAVFSVVQAGQTCRAVALQGGGDRGAYEAGALWGLVKNAKNPVDVQYNVVTGVSAGSINALAMMIYGIGEENQMVEFLNTSWRITSQKDVFHQWPGGYAEGLLFKPSLVNNDPELNYLRSQIYAEPNQRKSVLVTTDVNTGEKLAFTEQDWDTDADFAAHVGLFSSAIPGLFMYRQYDGYVFIDGGWAESIDIEDAVFRCREIADDDSDIIVDVIYCANSSFAVADAHKFNGLQMYTRGQDIVTWRKSNFLYVFTTQSFPEVQWRYFLIPSHVLPNQQIPLDFKPDNIDYMIKLGISDAIHVMGQGEGVSAQRAQQEFRSHMFADHEHYVMVGS